MTDIVFKQQLGVALQNHGKVDFVTSVLSRIQSGTLQLAPRRAVIIVRRLLIGLQAIVLLLNLAALTVLIRELFDAGTMDYLSVGTQFAETRDLALRAALESVPVVSVALVPLGLIGLAITIVVR